MLRRDEFAFIRDLLADGQQHDVKDKAVIKAEMLAMVAQAIDAKLSGLRKGQALGIVFRLDVVNSDGSLADAPDARLSPEATAWRVSVFVRDRYRCQECGATGALQAHHIVSWAEAPERRYDLDNGVTLCVDCHAAKHPERAAFVRGAKFHSPSSVLA
jgi:hypothetical protein